MQSRLKTEYTQNKRLCATARSLPHRQPSLSRVSHGLGAQQLLVPQFKRQRQLRFAVRGTAAAGALPADRKAAPEDEHAQQERRWGPLRAWHEWWALGRPGPGQSAAAHDAKKLSAIVSKLWAIMRVNYWLLAAALVCMVRLACMHRHRCCSRRCMCRRLCEPLSGQCQRESCGAKYVHCVFGVQAVAALSELAIPHFMTATIFSVTATGSRAKFYQNVKLLAVRVLLHPLSC